MNNFSMTSREINLNFKGQTELQSRHFNENNPLKEDFFLKLCFQRLIEQQSRIFRKYGLIDLI